MNTKKTIYHGYRFPAEVINHTVWLYHRFYFSLRDIEAILAERGIEVSYESIRNWCNLFGPKYSHKIKRRAERVYLWRAMDQDVDTIDLLVQKYRMSQHGSKNN